MPYNKALADRAVAFCGCLEHTKGEWAGKPFILKPWQAKHIRRIFGTVDKEGYRQYRTVYWSLPRKNGKSEIGAFIALYLLLADREAGAEVYGAAAERNQASIIFDVSKEMVRRSASLSSRLRTIDSQKRLVDHSTASVYRAISAEDGSKHGYNANGIIFDELHAQRKRDLWDVLSTSTGARRQPLTFVTTTAGFDRASICYEVYEYACKVRDGVIKDPTFYPMIYEAPENADWKDEEIWYQANPALGDFRSIHELRTMAERAKYTPALQNSFRRLYLNQWTQQSTRWIDLALWDDNYSSNIGEEALRGRVCYGGLDLSAVSDITAWVMVFPDLDDPDHIDVLCRFFVPEAQLSNEQNKYKANYQAWEKQGFLTTTPGNAVDYSFVKATILSDAQKFNVRLMNIDRLFQAHQIAQELLEEEMEVLMMGMGFISFGSPMKDFERRLLDKKINHGNNPVLRWMVDNVVVKEDPAGNLKPDKANSQGKIDGVIALVMALDGAIRQQQEEGSVYDTRGILTL